MENEAGRGGAGGVPLFAHQGSQMLRKSSPNPPPPPSCARELATLSQSGESALGDLDLNIIQMTEMSQIVQRRRRQC